MFGNCKNPIFAQNTDFMTKLLLNILLSFTLSVVAVATADAANRIEIIEVDQQVQIIASANSVRIVGAGGQILEIYNVTGVKVMTARVDGADKRFDLSLPTGCYIVKVGKVARKVSIR